MELEVTGECPECGAPFGMRIGGTMASLVPGSRVEDIIAGDDSAVHCSSCEEWVTPVNVDHEKK